MTLSPHQRRHRHQSRHRSRRRGDRGSASIELLGAIPYLALALIATLQLIFAVATVQATSAAARAGARAISQGDGDPTVSARRAVPSWVVDRMEVQTSGGLRPSVSVTTSIPILFPGLIDGPSVTRTAWFDPEQGVAPWG
jgi:hypothetical protein